MVYFGLRSSVSQPIDQREFAYWQKSVYTESLIFVKVYQEKRDDEEGKQNVSKTYYSVLT